jgi:hypothetical protein
MSERPRVSEPARWRPMDAERTAARAEKLRNTPTRPGRERFERAVNLMLTGPYVTNLPRDADNPAAFYERAKRLGLYRG